MDINDDGIIKLMDDGYILIGVEQDKMMRYLIDNGYPVSESKLLLEPNGSIERVYNDFITTRRENSINSILNER